jgi:hypothetical protein
MNSRAAGRACSSTVLERCVDVIFAYLDAGTGSLLVQLLVGGFAGLATFVKFRWGSIRGWRDRSKTNDVAPPPAVESSE